MSTRPLGSTTVPRTRRLRGLVRDGVGVAAGAKLVEVVPESARVFGLGERPARIAEEVAEAVVRFGYFGSARPIRRNRPPARGERA